MRNPKLLLSTQATPLLRLDAYTTAVTEAELYGIDLNATHDIRRILVASRSMQRAIANDQVRSLWIRPVQLEATGLQPFSDAVRASGDGRLPLFIVDVPNGIDHLQALKTQFSAAQRLRSAIGSTATIALALHARNYEGSRAHLDRVAMIRHQVSEWDFKLALDLTVKPDGTWEAEAAMSRILPQLALVRITVPRSLLTGGIRWRIASRVIAVITSGGYGEFLSLAPELSLWEYRSIGALADRSAMFADNVERRISRIRNEHKQLGRKPYR